MRLLTIDSETYDPLLKTHGTGWVFKYYYPEAPYEVIIFGFIDADGKEGVLDCSNPNDLIRLRELIQEHDSLLFHNALYDMGAALYLLKDTELFKDKMIYDTMILCKLDTQALMSYSLDALTNHSKVLNKEGDKLDDYAWQSGMYQKWVWDNALEVVGKGRNCNTRPTTNVLHNWCMSDVRRFPRTILDEYCLQDIRATKSLFNAVFDRVS